jgi:hypothetical protein
MAIDRSMPASRELHREVFGRRHVEDTQALMTRSNSSPIRFDRAQHFHLDNITSLQLKTSST